jgi:hypothetical protein
MNILITQRGRAAGHDEVRIELTLQSERLPAYRIQARADSDAACPIVLTEVEIADDLPGESLDLSRQTVTRLIAALETPPTKRRVVTNFDQHDFEIVPDPAMDRLLFIDRDEGAAVEVSDAPATRHALAEALRITLHYFDRDTAALARAQA